MSMDIFQDDVFEGDIIFMHFSHNLYNRFILLNVTT